MKRYVFLVGGTGARLADALLCAACAGAFPEERLNVLLADTDHRGVRSAGLVAAKMADYSLIQQNAMIKDGPFRTDVAFSSWPKSLPDDASTLGEYTAHSEEDALLSQAFFDRDATELDLREGFHGRRMLGMVTYAGLLHQADQDPEDVLSGMVDDMVQTIEREEEVRVVLAGSVCGGTGAAGIMALARYLRKRTEDRVNLGAVLLTACDDEQDAAQANEALKAYAAEGLLETVCVLGLPRASRTNAPAEFARLTDWLAVYCMDVLLHRPVWFKGVFTVQAPEGPLSWGIFGKAAERYRLCYGGLIKFATLWVTGLSGQVERRLRHPFFLRDGLFGWYAHFFRRMRTSRQDQLDMGEALTRLMNVCLIWLGGVCKTLPADLRNASALGKAREEAEQHYAELTDLVSRLAVMDNDAQLAELYDDSIVYREKNMDEATEAEEALRRISAAKQEIERRDGERIALGRRMGGAALMDMLQDALETARAESEELHARYDEAVRRIDHAESIAPEKDQYRITDARTKLRRMERHMLMADSRLERIQADTAAARQAEVRFDKPAMTPAPAENELLIPEAADMLLHQDKLTHRNLGPIWHRMIRPGSTRTMGQTMKAIRSARVVRDAPLGSLVLALVKASMKEV